jgi:hypothetical protein
MDPFARETVTEYDEIVQDAYHVIEEDNGSNPDDPDRGLGVANSSSKALADVSATTTTSAEKEVERDERIDSCAAMLSVDPTTGLVTLDLDIKVDDQILQTSVESENP